MYAIIETGAKQYKVSVGDEIKIEKLDVEVGSSIELDKVVALNNEGKFVAGTPYVEGAKVKVNVLEQGKSKKVIIFKYLAKKDFRKKKGHRQPYTLIKVEDILV